MAKNLYVIAGPNGAGKTTFAREFLPHFAHCDEFVNADLIASGLSPFAPQEMSVRAGRLLLARLKELAAHGKTFGFETTLAGQGINGGLRNGGLGATGSISSFFGCRRKTSRWRA